MRFLFTALFITLSALCCAQSQYYPEHDITLLDTGYAPMGATHIAAIEISEQTYMPERDFDSVVNHLKRHNGNIGRIETIRYKKRKRSKKIRTQTLLYIWKANNAEHAKVVPQKQYNDSLRATLIDTTKESILIIFANTNLHTNAYSMVPEMVTFKVNGIAQPEGCFIKPFEVCSYVTTEDVPLRLGHNENGAFGVHLSPGKVYFAEYKSGGNFKLVSFDYGYRICSLYQKIKSRMK